MVIGIDGRLKACPADVAMKHPAFIEECMQHHIGIKKWLRILADPK